MKWQVFFIAARIQKYFCPWRSLSWSPCNSLLVVRGCPLPPDCLKYIFTEHTLLEKMQAMKRCSLGQDFVLVAQAKHKVHTVPKANEIKSSVRLSVRQAPCEDTTGNMGEDLPQFSTAAFCSRQTQHIQKNRTRAVMAHNPRPSQRVSSNSNEP